MENLLYNIINEVKAKMPELSTVDEDYGQLENLDNESEDMYPLTFPAVLIDAPQVVWSGIEGNHQKGTATIRVRLIIDCYDDTHYASETMEAMKLRHEQSARLNNILQGFRPDGGAPMSRQTTTFGTVGHGIKVYGHEYTVTVTDYHKPATTTKPKVGIGVVFDK